MVGYIADRGLSRQARRETSSQALLRDARRLTWDRIRQQLLYQCSYVVLQCRMTCRVAWPRETRMSFLHQPIAADEERSRPAVQVHSLRNLLRKLVGRAS